MSPRASTRDLGVGSFIWTEAFGCGDLLNVVIGSYLKHHKSPIWVFGYPEDFEKLELVDERVRRVQPGTQGIDDPFLEKIRMGYVSGHVGTARLWSFLIRTRPERFLIHVDADIALLGPA